MEFIKGVLIGFIGRPFLWLIKWLRWPLLIGGFYFNAISVYDPKTNISTSEQTFLPLIAGILLFSVGLTIKRYDERYKELNDLCKKMAGEEIGGPKPAETMAERVRGN